MEEFELLQTPSTRGGTRPRSDHGQHPARRFRQKGNLRLYVRIWRVMLQSHLGTSPEKLRRICEGK
jgi:hypothetical protein